MHQKHTQAEAPETRGATIHWAKAYDKLALSEILTFGKIREIRRWMVEKAGLQPGDQVLDVGCGPGYITLLAKERVGPRGRAAGIDASPEMIEKSAVLGRFRTLCGRDYTVGGCKYCPVYAAHGNAHVSHRQNCLARNTIDSALLFTCRYVYWR